MSLQFRVADQVLCVDDAREATEAVVYEAGAGGMRFAARMSVDFTDIPH